MAPRSGAVVPLHAGLLFSHQQQGHDYRRIAAPSVTAVTRPSRLSVARKEGVEGNPSGEATIFRLAGRLPEVQLVLCAFVPAEHSPSIELSKSLKFSP
jgi:hypothetical protein